MKNIMNKRITVACLISLVFVVFVVFLIQSQIMKNTAVKTSQTRIEDVITKISEKAVETEEMKEELNQEYIGKASTFAEMIKLNPDILDDQDTLDEIAEMLDVDELHVTDDKGVIQWGTVPDYFGFDFSTSDQAGEFMVILDDPTIKIAQDAQPNGTEGKYFQYVSVGRQDETGIVQIGLTPSRLQNQLETNSIENLLADVSVGNNGYIFAINKSDGTVAAHKNTELIGLAASEIGVTDKMLSASSTGGVRAKIDGSSVLCCKGETDDYYIFSAMYISEVYSGRAAVALIFVIATLIGNTVIILLINSVVNKVMIGGVNELITDMETITAGNYETKVNVNTCPEYRLLSEGINDMLMSIRNSVEEAMKRNEEQKRIFDETDVISSDISVQSGEMRNVASRLSQGSSTQAATVQELTASFSTVSNQIKSSADAAKNASRISEETTKSVDEGTEKLSQMQSAMERIEESSTKISNIVKTIDDIAFQTNILALNAAVEAARAGQHGKGFAVVADEVRNLANKSAEATKGTAKLIEETKVAVADGAKIADETAMQLKSMMKGIEESNRLIEHIAEAADEQASAFEQISDSMLQISDVVQQNAEISAEAEDTARKLDDQARALKALFGES
jgi:methyl-accepting chemotaxis protein